jgi:hypothetical protein
MMFAAQAETSDGRVRHFYRVFMLFFVSRDDLSL